MDQAELIKGLRVVCKCKAVKYRTIKQAITQGATTIEEIRRRTNANTGCTQICRQAILDMIDECSPNKESNQEDKAP